MVVKEWGPRWIMIFPRFNLNGSSTDMHTKHYHWTQWAFREMFHHFFDENLGTARPISELEAHFAAAGSEGLRASSHRKPPSFSAEEWKGFSYEKKQHILEGFRLAYREEALVNWCAALGTVLGS